MTQSTNVRLKRVNLRLAASRSITFKQCAAEYIKAHGAGWRNAKHRHQWENTLATYAELVIGALPVASVDMSLALKILEPIRTTKTETATRLRGRIESILDWARVRGYREGETPPGGGGHLDKLLVRLSKSRRSGTCHATL